MKPIYSVIVFLILITTSAISSIHNYHSTQWMIEEDLNHALVQTLKTKSEGWITPDTIKTYKNNISITALRDYAYISYALPKDNRTGITSKSMKWHGNGKTFVFKGYAACSMATMLSLSDQRLPMTLASLAMLWAIFSLAIRKKQEKNVVYSQTASFGGIILDEVQDIFTDKSSNEIHLTPMQHQLMKLFFSAENHKLSKDKICSSLWPKKEDASDTLYTLIKRLRPTLEKHSSLKIVSDRGKAYHLKAK